MWNRLITAVAVSICALLLSAADASAWLKVKNNTNDTLTVALMLPQPNCAPGVDWRVRGYWILRSGETKSVLGGNLEYISYYLHVRPSQGGQWLPSAGVGSATACVHPTGPFDSCAFRGCPSTWRVQRFIEVNTGDTSVNHTVNLNPVGHTVCSMCNNGSCQCGGGTAPQLCAAHGGVDPTLGCSSSH
jgi:uncharacterized membrane protein